MENKKNNKKISYLSTYVLQKHCFKQKGISQHFDLEKKEHKKWQESKNKLILKPLPNKHNTFFFDYLEDHICHKYQAKNITKQ